MPNIVLLDTLDPYSMAVKLSSLRLELDDVAILCVPPAFGGIYGVSEPMQLATVGGHALSGRSAVGYQAPDYERDLEGLVMILPGEVGLRLPRIPRVTTVLSVFLHADPLR